MHLVVLTKVKFVQYCNTLVMNYMHLIITKIEGIYSIFVWLKKVRKRFVTVNKYISTTTGNSHKLM